jgi:hypothetical protein
LLFFHHDVLLWAIHALLAWPSCATFLLAHRLMIASILTICLKRWSYSPSFFSVSQ